MFLINIFFVAPAPVLQVRIAFCCAVLLCLVGRCRLNTSARPRVLKALVFQFLESSTTTLSNCWFQHSTQPAPPYTPGCIGVLYLKVNGKKKKLSDDKVEVRSKDPMQGGYVLDPAHGFLCAAVCDTVHVSFPGRAGG